MELTDADRRLLAAAEEHGPGWTWRGLARLANVPAGSLWKRVGLLKAAGLWPHGDPAEAALPTERHALALEWLPLALGEARRRRRRRPDLDLDLESEATLALVRAARDYRADDGHFPPYLRSKLRAIGQRAAMHGRSGGGARDAVLGRLPARVPLDHAPAYARDLSPLDQAIFNEEAARICG